MINTCNQIRLITRIAAIACLISMLLSFNIWMNERSFPTSPIFDFLPTIFHPIDYIIIVLVFITLILIAIVRNPQKLIVLFLVVGLILLVFDLNRWQPWFYQYYLMFFLFSFFNYRCDDTKQQVAIISIIKIMIAAIYFWSGLHKFNPNFIADTFPWLMEPITDQLGENSLSHFKMLGYAFPIIESVSGIFLLINPIKKLGMILIISMHVFILIVIGPLGHNYNPVVWPWNIAMIAFSLILFNNEQDFKAIDFRNMFRYHSIKIVFVLFILMPQLNFFNKWDSYLSHNLYSGNTSSGDLYFSKETKECLPNSIQKYAVISDHEYVIAIKYWCMQETGVPAYPEQRNFVAIKNALYRYSRDTSEIYMIFTPKLKLND
jgi:hypothetical protein